MTKSPLFEATVPGAAAGSKNALQVVFPALPGGIKKHLFAALKLSPGQMRARIAAIAKTANPSIVGNADRQRWMKAAENRFTSVARSVRREHGLEPGPLFPSGNLLHVRTIVYMAEGQTGDLNNFEHGVWDALEHAGVIANDSWINCHDGSKRVWTDPYRPRVEVSIWDLGEREMPKLPEVRVHGLKKYSEDPLAENAWTAVTPAGVIFSGEMSPEMNRRRLVSAVAQAWDERTGEPAPDGTQIYVGTWTAPATQQTLGASSDG